MTRSECAGATAIAAICLILLAVAFWPIARGSWGSGWWGIGVAVAFVASASSVFLPPIKARAKREHAESEKVAVRFHKGEPVHHTIRQLLHLR